MRYYLAIDIGASSGRHILGHIENGRMIIEEIHRFPNGMIQKDGELCWDFDALWSEILSGMNRCAELGKIPESVGIDTWGVDFVLLDENNVVLGNTVAYRDSRTNGMDAEVYKHISEEDLYRRTGTAKQQFNTIYQLMAVKRDSRPYLSRAKQILFIPDYLHYRLSGVAKTEYTIASTSGLLNANQKTWDEDIISACGYPRGIFAEIVSPGTVLGDLTHNVQKQVSFNCKVILPSTHDTASAIMAVPSTEEHTLYISSGTWSLMGVEQLLPNCSDESRAFNLTNEGGYDYRYRYLKNIMGLWMIQSVRKELSGNFTYAELCELAEKESINSLVDCNHKRFLSPVSMIREIQNACRENNTQIPETPGELAAVIYGSLAACYRDTALELERLTGQEFRAIHIVGGGSKDEYLNRLTAKITGKNVFAGPPEATAIGNLMAQIIGGSALSGLKSGRECVMRSFEIKRYSY